MNGLGEQALARPRLTEDQDGGKAMDFRLTSKELLDLSPDGGESPAVTDQVRHSTPLHPPPRKFPPPAKSLQPPWLTTRFMSYRLWHCSCHSAPNDTNPPRRSVSNEEAADADENPIQSRSDRTDRRSHDR